ncbi:TM0106 family RecB-like putative nuclease [Rhizobium sullae]|uniref:TM0106 family RecB-like putative nuclease n=1 Tax=Rhizobium sullae TaxID=50338 RepID=UPI000B357C4D|nr:TM0106 family RecB-like putative nuclease [Rhizobium sullae]
MKAVLNQIQLSSSDLVGHLNCGHLTGLDLRSIAGELAKPTQWDPLLEILRERGFRHEAAFIEHLVSLALSVEQIGGVGIEDTYVSATIAAMKRGVDVIVQGALRNGNWAGRVDVLRKVARPSKLGDWSYEIYDTKLARETRGGTVLQLCLYSDLLAAAQGCEPEFTYVVVPWTEFKPERLRVADYGAYYRKAKSATEAAVANGVRDTYPEPTGHCDICRWFEICDKRRRDDDHLSFVAGISRNQIAELTSHDINTLDALAQMPLPMPWKPERGAAQSYERVREQARIQAEARHTCKPNFELLPVETGLGLSGLPEPNEGDVFFDLEGDPFVGEHGLEYLFGYHYQDDGGQPAYVCDWSFDRAGEKAAFERFVDFVVERRKTYPGLHVYHFAPYEPAALKRLMGRYATREDEIDHFLRNLVFVDLYSVVRNGVRASVESYSIKRLETFYGYERNVTLRDANIALSAFQAGLELDDVSSITEAERDIVKGYNEDDCVSTRHLRDWLEERRSQLVADGVDVPRRPLMAEVPGEELSERQKRVAELTEKLLANIPVDELERSPEQHAQWILANILDWHRREDKAVWWEYFRLKDLSADELIDERAALAGLTFVGEAAVSKGKTPTHRYKFVAQDTDVRPGKLLCQVGGNKFGSVVEISSESGTIDIKKRTDTAAVHPQAVFVHEHIRADEQAGALLRIGEFVVDNGITGTGRFQAARELLMRLPPHIDGNKFQQSGHSTLAAANRIANKLEQGVLPIQGPPGTGKSHTGARMICQFVADGKKVGITANSHKVIRNLLDKVIEAAEELNLNVRCIQKPEADNSEVGTARLGFAKKNEDLINAMTSGEFHVAGATSFLWARADAEDVLDVLFVDEAAQMSLANVLAVSQAAKRLVLLGDPQQLDQPSQGAHPDGVGVSSLEHVLGGQQTIGPEQGLFLAETWRMHPDVCAFISELFYESKLAPIAACVKQRIVSTGAIRGSGLRYLPVQHSGNASTSIEEAEAVAALVTKILKENPQWVDRDGKVCPLSLDDVVIITPYNAQVLEIQKRLPSARVGTVDKFQGQEAPIAIYSMATSSYAEAPRGMEFLYSSNRFNVAISRAKCLAILVASPAIFDVDCKTPRQMQLANSFCRYLELATTVQ